MYIKTNSINFTCVNNAVFNKASVSRKRLVILALSFIPNIPGNEAIGRSFMKSTYSLCSFTSGTV